MDKEMKELLENREEMKRQAMEELGEILHIIDKETEKIITKVLENAKNEMTKQIGLVIGRECGEVYKVIEKMTTDKVQKPIKGLVPKWLHKENRLIEIKSAIDRYTEGGIEVPKEWIEEFEELLKAKSKKVPNDMMGTEDGSVKSRDSTTTRFDFMGRNADFIVAKIAEYINLNPRTEKGNLRFEVRTWE